MPEQADVSRKKDSGFTRVEELVYEVKIEDVMTSEPITAAPEDLIGEVRNKMSIRRISGIPVVEGGRLSGIISTEDIIKALEKGHIYARVRDKMSSSTISCYTDEPLARAISRFDMYGYGRLPVLDRTGKLAGIITRGDIIHGLLRALEKDYHEEETLRKEAIHLLQYVESDHTRILLSYKIKSEDFRNSGNAARQIKRALVFLGAHHQKVRRVAIATFEAETNLMIHGQGGRIVSIIEPHSIRVWAIDHGPGIPDIEQVLKPGFSTAPEWARELGFGSGMGLNNIQRCADEMKIDSHPGKGTTVRFKIISNEHPNTRKNPAEEKR